MLRQDDFQHILIEKDDGVCVLRLNRPEKLNALNNRLHTELSLVFERAQADPEANVVVITGAGSAFTVGGEASADRDLATGIIEARRIIESIIDLEKPFIAAVNGRAIGIGATIASLADISFMDRSGKFGDTHVRDALTAGNGSAVIWPLLVGVNQAKRLLLTGAVISAEEAASLGLVTEVVDDGTAFERAMAIAKRLNGYDPFAVRTTKVAINHYLRNASESVLRLGLAYEQMAMGRAAFAEVMRAALARQAQG